MHEQVANILIKSIPIDKFIYFRLHLDIYDFESKSDVSWFKISYSWVDN